MCGGLGQLACFPFCCVVGCVGYAACLASDIVRFVCVVLVGLPVIRWIVCWAYGCGVVAAFWFCVCLLVLTTVCVWGVG